MWIAIHLKSIWELRENNDWLNLYVFGRDKIKNKIDRNTIIKSNFLGVKTQSLEKCCLGVSFKIGFGEFGGLLGGVGYFEAIIFWRFLDITLIIIGTFFKIKILLLLYNQLN